jgi:NitT/TauT family transport system ATP-binding protein
MRRRHSASLLEAAATSESPVAVRNRRSKAEAPVNPGGEPPGLPDTVVRLTEIGFHYQPDRPIIAGVSMDIRRGEIKGIVGPSGCGKSTLLRMVAGLSKPTMGTVEWKLYGSDHPIAMMFQGDTLSPAMTVAANVDLFFRYNRKLGLSRAERSKRVRETLEMVGLAGFSHFYPGQLSGGMRRRVIFAAALIAKPQLLLLDEPFSAVDEPTRVGIHEDVLRILRKYQITTVLVTHDLAEAVSLCDQVVILSRAPAKTVASHSMNMPREIRIQQLREHPSFLDSYGRLWSELSSQLGPQPDSGARQKTEDA